MNRKEIVLKLSEHFGVEHTYLGAPSFAYEIAATEETYTVDTEGVITTSAGTVITLDEIMNPEQQEEETEAQPETETWEEEKPEEETEIWQEPETAEEEPKDNQEETEIPITETFEFELPLGEHTGRTLINIINMLTSKQHLIMKAFELTDELLAPALAEELSYKEISTKEDFEAALLELGRHRCRGLAFDFENDTFTFKLAASNLTPEKKAAFQDLALLIDENAKKLKRASFKLTQDDNPKFAFRTWLTRLGMNGKDYKATRKVLLANLEGSGAFRNGNATKEQASE